VSDAFWSKVDRSGGPHSCWPWTGAQRRGGYGVITRRNGETVAHREAYRLASGQPAGALLVCHHCDNRLCCNPAHLFLGTHADNMRDMAQKGRRRGPRGSDVWTAKLDESLAEQIRARHRAGESQRALARAFGVSQRQVWSVVHGLAWSGP
jgi:hypothetical protein